MKVAEVASSRSWRLTLVTNLVADALQHSWISDPPEPENLHSRWAKRATFLQG